MCIIYAINFHFELDDFILNVLFEKFFKLYVSMEQDLWLFYRFTDKPYWFSLSTENIVYYEKT